MTEECKITSQTCIQSETIAELVRCQRGNERWQREQNGSIKRTELMVDKLDSKMDAKMDMIYAQLITNSNQVGNIQGRKESRIVTTGLTLKRFHMWLVALSLFVSVLFSVLNFLL